MAAAKCTWRGGCKLKTVDPSTLCHHHRRFSANVSSLQRGHNGMNNRMMASSMLRSKAPADSQDLRLVQALLSARPIVSGFDHGADPRHIVAVAPFRSDTITIFGQRVKPPVSGDHFDVSVRETRTGTPYLTMDYSKSPNKVDAGRTLMDEAVKIADDEYSYNMSNYVGVDNPLIEQYDDVPEIIAQFDLGEIAGGRLAISDMSDGTQLLRFSSDHEGAPGFVSRVGSMGIHKTVGDEYAERFGVIDCKADDGYEMDSNMNHVVERFVQLRQSVRRYAHVDEESGHISIPAGWDSMEPLRFP